MAGAADAEPLPGSGITSGQDGVLRWAHEVNLWKNPTILITVAKVMLFAALVPALLVGVLTLFDGDGVVAALRTFAEVGGLSIGIVAVLTLIAYPLLALLMGGRYYVVFEMDAHGVKHIQLRKQFERNQALMLVTMLAGIAGSSPQTTGAGLLAASRQSLHTTFTKVRQIRINERRGVIYLAEKFSRNQVYAAPEDFAFVRDYIVSRCPKALVRGDLEARGGFAPR